MSIKPESDDYATIRLTHHATASDRRDQVRHHPSRPKRPECLVIGHAWTEEPGREGGSICMTCQVIRFP